MATLKISRWITVVFFCMIALNAKSQCTAEFTYEIDDSGSNVTFTNLSVGDASITYYWEFGDGDSVAGVKDPVHNYFKDSVYLVCLYISDSSCADTFCAHINICGIDCVWPGDANDDGVANVWDILPIGLAYNEQGKDRMDQTMNWEGKYSENWDTAFKSNLNYKYADCNGSGLINLVDAEAIFENYGMTHNKTGSQGSSKAAVNLRLEADKDSVIEGDSVNITISLGDSFNIANNVYGLAFCIGYNADLVDSATFKVDFTNSWIGDQDTMLSMYKDHWGLGQTDIGMVRNNKKDKSGNGKIAKASIFIEDNIDGKIGGFWTLELTVCNLVVIGKDEVVINVGVVTETIIITGTDDLRNKDINNITVYPNPANDEIHIQFDNNRAEEICMSNILGQVVYCNEDNIKDHLKIDVSAMHQGIYFLKLKFGEVIIVRKVVITK